MGQVVGQRRLQVTGEGTNREFTSAVCMCMFFSYTHMSKKKKDKIQSKKQTSQLTSIAESFRNNNRIFCYVVKPLLSLPNNNFPHSLVSPSFVLCPVLFVRPQEWSAACTWCYMCLRREWDLTWVVTWQNVLKHLPVITVLITCLLF